MSVRLIARFKIDCSRGLDSTRCGDPFSDSYPVAIYVFLGERKLDTGVDYGARGFMRRASPRALDPDRFLFETVQSKL